MISYLSDVLCNIHYLTNFVGFFLIAWSFVQYMLNNVAPKEFTKNVKAFFIAGIVCGVISIITPTSLKYDIVKQYQENNLELQKQVVEMQTVVAKYKLQKELEQLRGN